MIVNIIDKIKKYLNLFFSFIKKLNELIIMQELEELWQKVLLKMQNHIILVVYQNNF